MVRALLFTGESGQFAYYKEAIARLKRYQVVVDICCDRDDPGIYDLLQKGASELGVGFWYHDGDASIPKQTFYEKWLQFLFFMKQWRNPVYRDCRKKLNTQLLNRMIKFHRYRFRAAYKIIKESQAEIILMPEDGIGSNYWAITAAIQLGKKVAVIPFGLGDSKVLIYKGIAEKHADGSLIDTSSVGGALVKKYWPGWVKELDKYGEVLFLPPEFIAALSLCDIQLEDPWVVQGGGAHKILIESIAMRDRYLSDNVPRDKMHISGTIYCDMLFDGLEKTGKDSQWLEKGKRYNQDRLSVLVCVPPSESKYWFDKSEFSSVAEYCLKLQKFFAKNPRYDVKYSFHPRMFAEDKKYVEEIGIIAETQNTINLIPACDVVITNLSSISRWSLVASRPNIDFDIFNFSREEFPDCEGYLYRTKFEEITQELDKLLNDDNYYQQISYGCKSIRDNFDKIDGLSAKKLANAINELLSETAN